jgi:hypothetical protein
MFAAIALDTAGRPHISYYDLANRSLKYAYYAGSAWWSETVDNAGDVGFLPVIGKPYYIP